MGKIKLLRHGDILLKQPDGFKIPKGVKMTAMKLLHQGLNHAHTIKKGRAVSGELNGVKYMRVKERMTVVHDEHGKGIVPVGDYIVEIKSEYDHFKEESKRVVD